MVPALNITEAEWVKLTEVLTTLFSGDLRQSFMGRKIQITLIEGDTRAYAHFQIWPSDKSAAAQHSAAALFHLFCASDPTFLDDVLNSPENGMYQVTRAQKVDVGDFPSTTALETGFTFKRESRTTPLLHLGKAPVTQSLLVDDEFACEMLVARYNAGVITYQEAYAKSYTVA